MRLAAFIASVLLACIFPAPLTLLAAGVLQSNPGVLFQETLGRPNVVLAYRFAAPFVGVFALALAAFGYHQHKQTYRVPKHYWWHTGFLLLGATFGAASLMAFQIAFGGGLFSIPNTIAHILLGCVAGALSALPVSMLWFYVTRRRVREERRRGDMGT